MKYMKCFMKLRQKVRDTEFWQMRVKEIISLDAIMKKVQESIQFISMTISKTIMEMQLQQMM